MPATQGRDFFRQLSALVDEIGKETGNTKTADAMTEPDGRGACGADTSSPTASADDGCTTVSTGQRAQEMSAAVKDYGNGSIDAAPDASAGGPSAEDRIANVGLTQSGIGNDPAQEDNYTGNLPEPGVGTETKAKFDDGQKYASENFMKLGYDKRGEVLSQLANQILADIASSQSSMPSTAKTANVTSDPATTSPVDTLVKEAQAGYELASAIGMEKYSADERAQMVLQQTMADALFDADLVSEFFKRAAEEENTEEPPEDAPAASSSDSDASAGGIPGEPSPEEMAAGVDSMGGGGGGGEGGLSRDDVIQQLLMAMQEMGITPEELMAVASEGGAGGMPPEAAGGMPPEMAGGMPPEAAGGMPPEMAGGMPPEQKLAYAQHLAKVAKEYQRAGKFEIKSACTKAERSARNQIKNVLRELMA